MHINELPVELLLEIFSYLTAGEKFCCERVCYHWQRNVFLSMNSLAFQYGDDFRQNDFFKQKQLLHQGDEAMSCIISKCGQYLRAFKGSVSLATMHAIAEQCKGLRNVDMRFFDVETFRFLTDIYLSSQGTSEATIGEQITCATLYGHLIVIPYSVKYPSLVPLPLSSFIDKCPNLNSLSITSESYRSTDSIIAVPHSVGSLKNLQTFVIKKFVTQEELRTLALCSKLNKVNIAMANCIHESAAWECAIANWSRLTSLSLTLQVDHSMCYDYLPPNLEHLELNIFNKISSSTSEDIVDYSESNLIFRNVMPQLKSLNLYQRVMPISLLNVILISVSRCLQNLQEFSFFCVEPGKYAQNYDEHYEPLLSLTTLKKLAIGAKISEDFATRLITSLKHLTSFGAPTKWVEGYHLESYLPDGQNFWTAFKTKAASHPSKYFNLIGRPAQSIYLYELLPPNVTLGLQYQCKVTLTNGFGGTDQWQKLMERSTDLRNLTIEIKDTNFNLSGLSKSLRTLNVICLNEAESKRNYAFMFGTRLRILQELRIFQETMSNKQLEATLSCISDRCPFLEKLCIGRGNVNDEPIDKLAACLFECHHLKSLCCNENFVLGAEFRTKWHHIENLKYFPPIVRSNNLRIGNMDCPCFSRFLDSYLT